MAVFSPTGSSPVDKHFRAGKDRASGASSLPAEEAGAASELRAEASSILTDRSYLTSVQYRTPQNLAARQSAYAYQRPHIDLVGTVLELAGLRGTETVADVGCGNGAYLAGLARRGHTGRVLGVDLSPGMLAAARGAAPEAALLVGDAAALPLADRAADVILAPHMLYHVPDRAAAARQFRRVTRPGGAVLVVLNGQDHLAELRELLYATASGDRWGLAAEEIVAEYRTYPGMTLDAGEQLLAQVFGSVVRHDFVAELVLPGPEPVAAYVASMRATQAMSDPAGFVAAAIAQLQFDSAGSFRVRTHSGLLVCR